MVSSSKDFERFIYHSSSIGDYPVYEIIRG
jgi:hypothetical protein